MAFKYTVKAGQTASQIASQFNLTPEQLLKANPGVFQFSTGMGIRIPTNVFGALTGQQQSQLTPQAKSILSRTSYGYNASTGGQYQQLIPGTPGRVDVNRQVANKPWLNLHEGLHAYDANAGRPSATMQFDAATRKQLVDRYYSSFENGYRGGNFGNESHIPQNEAFAAGGQLGPEGVPAGMEKYYSGVFSQAAPTEGGAKPNIFQQLFGKPQNFQYSPNNYPVAQALGQAVSSGAQQAVGLQPIGGQQALTNKAYSARLSGLAAQYGLSPGMAAYSQRLTGLAAHQTVTSPSPFMTMEDRLAGTLPENAPPGMTGTGTSNSPQGQTGFDTDPFHRLSSYEQYKAIRTYLKHRARNAAGGGGPAPQIAGYGLVSFNVGAG
jgi:hypothetical protein